VGQRKQCGAGFKHFLAVVSGVGVTWVRSFIHTWHSLKAAYQKKNLSYPLEEGEIVTGMFFGFATILVDPARSITGGA
jgi:hypothetical protein